MRIALVYPPPWKIAASGERAYPPEEGEPEGGAAALRDGDFSAMPYGLLSLAAQAIAAGHQVLTLNLSLFAWSRVERIISKVEADVFGLSCYTINRRGVDALSRAVRQLHPQAHVTVGGPHATALPTELLEHYRAVDTVVIGEGEATFRELLGRLETGDTAAGTPGLAWRAKDQENHVQVGPPRAHIADLDSLVSPVDEFATPVVLTSRGCSWECTFCAAPVLWGRTTRFHSAEYVLDLLERAVAGHGLRRIALKDDTFTAHRARVLAICEGIEERGLSFVWSCDTRADRLDDELLLAMRRAGCQRLSLGVESGSPEVLRRIKKRTTPEQVLRATRIAQKYGFDIRFYMMLGNPGESLDTLRDSLALIERAKPSEVTFSALAGYPGTAVFDQMVAERRVSPAVFFEKNLVTPVFYLGRKEDRRALSTWHDRHAGHYLGHSPYGLEDRKRTLARLPDLPAAYLDVGAACLQAGKLEEAEEYLSLAREKGYPVPELVLNYRARVAALGGDRRRARALLEEAADGFPSEMVRRNLERLDGRPEALVAHHDFEPDTRFIQPMRPGPVDLDAWRVA